MTTAMRTKGSEISPRTHWGAPPTLYSNEEGKCEPGHIPALGSLNFHLAQALISMSHDTVLGPSLMPGCRCLKGEVSCFLCQSEDHCESCSLLNGTADNFLTSAPSCFHGHWFTRDKKGLPRGPKINSYPPASKLQSNPAAASQCYQGGICSRLLCFSGCGVEMCLHLFFTGMTTCLH